MQIKILKYMHVTVATCACDPFTVYHITDSDQAAEGGLALAKTLGSRQWNGRHFIKQDISYPVGQ